MPEQPAARGAPPRTVALLPWGDLIEDFLDSIGVSFEAFATEMTGGWLFGYIDALRTRGIRTVLFCVSARIGQHTNFTHSPTGATICVLPASRAYRRLRRPVRNPYGWTLEECIGPVNGSRRLLLGLVKDVLPYLATPPRLLLREIRRFGCSRILCQEYEYARFDVCVRLGRMARIPVFATFQGGDWQMSRLERWVRPSSIRSCSGLIVAAGTELVRLRERYPAANGKTAQIANPIDPAVYGAVDRETARAELGIPPATRCAVWHGRVDMHRKGLDVLVDAWERVCRARPAGDLELLLLGTGSEAGRLRQRLDESRLCNVRWKDEYVQDRTVIARWLRAADVHVYPSRHEGFPVAPLEAMASGLPVIVSDAPGMREIVGREDECAGLMVPSGDADALATTLLRLLDDEALCGRMGDNARRRVETKFSLEAVGAELEAFLFG